MGQRIGRSGPRTASRTRLFVGAIVNAAVVLAVATAHAQDRAAGGDVTDEQIRGAFLRAAPFGVAGLVVMAVLAWLLVRHSAASPSRSAPRGDSPLPEELRVVRVPGLEYTVEAASGVVMDKETTVRTSVRTTTTGGQVYSVGSAVHSTPLHTETNVTTEQSELLWVRLPDGREATWTFAGASFQARASHAVSVISRQRADGTAEHLLAYNHATGQLASLPGVTTAHAPRLGPAIAAATIAGSLVLSGAFWTMLRIGPEPVRGLEGWLSAWTSGGCVAAAVAPVIVFVTCRIVARRRRAEFEARYVPGFRTYLASLSAH